MTLQESLALMSLFQLTYVSFKKSNEELISLAKIWQSVFSDVPYRVVEMAAKDYIQNENTPFAPAPGQIRARMDEIRETAEPTKYEAWEMVRKGLRLSGTVFGRSDMPSRNLSDREKYFYDLPDKIRLAVGGYGHYCELAMTDHEQLEYRRSNFYSRYEEMRGHEKVIHRTNPELLKFLGHDENGVARFRNMVLEKPKSRQLESGVLSLDGDVDTQKDTIRELRDRAIEERRKMPELAEGRRRRDYDMAKKAEEDFLSSLDEELAN